MTTNLMHRMMVNLFYEHVEDKPGYVWLSKRHMLMINTDALVAYLEGRDSKFLELPDNMCTQRCCLKNHNSGIIKCDEECNNRTRLL